jgi:hypothetical protein
MSQQPIHSADDPTVATRSKDRVVSGRVIVAAMFVWGLALASLLFVYFEFNTRPFRPLSDAIGREFKRSRPNVEGGRLKGRGAMRLRITMSVPFDPIREDPKSKDVLVRVLSLARQHQDLTRYEKCEVNLIHFVPEKTAITKSFEWSGADVAKADFVP